MTLEQILYGVIVASLTGGSLLGALRLYAFRRPREARAEVTSGEAWKVSFDELRKTVEWQGGEIARLRQAEAEWRTREYVLEDENAALKSQIVKLTSRVSELETKYANGAPGESGGQS